MPSISTVIPAMDHIDKHLATAAENPQYSVALHSALAIGKQILNEYYNKTDYSEVEVFTLPLVFRPESHLSPGIPQDSSRNLTFRRIVDGI